MGGRGPGEARQLRGSFTLGAALAVALSQAGWATEAPPGEPVTLRSASGSLDPFATVQALAKGELGAEAWAQRCERLGIADLELLSATAAKPRVTVRPVAPEAPRAPVRAPAPAAVAAGTDAKARTRRCWRCKEPVDLPAESGGKRPRCAKCGTLQWVPV